MVNQIISDTVTTVETNILSLLSSAIDDAKVQSRRSAGLSGMQPESGRFFGCSFFAIAAGLLSLATYAWDFGALSAGFGFVGVVLDIAADQDVC